MAEVISILTRLNGGQAAAKEIQQVDTSIERLERRSASASQKLAAFGSSLSRIGTTLSIGLTLPIVGIGAAVTKMASDAVESENLFEVAMGGMADAGRRFSEELRDQLGLNAFEVRKNLATFQQMTVSMGFTEEAAFALSSSMTRLTTDMASFFNLRPEDAFLKLQSAISGEVEPLRRLGIDISETTLELEAMKRGLEVTSSELTQQQKIMLRFLAITSQTTNAQGDLARTLESPANAFRILRSRVEQTAIELGTALLPVVQNLLSLINTTVVPAIEGMVGAFKNLSPSMQGVVVAGIALVAAIGPLFKVGGLIFTALASLPKLAAGFKAVTAALLPLSTTIIGLLIPVIAGFIATTEGAGQAFESFGKVITTGAKLIGAEIEVAFRRVGLAIVEMLNQAGLASQAAVTAADAALAVAAVGAQRAGFEMRDALAGAADTGGELMDNMGARIKDVFEGLGDAITEPFAKIGEGAKVSADEIRKSYEESAAQIEAALRKSLAGGGVQSAKDLAKEVKKQSDDFQALLKEQTEFALETGRLTLEGRRAQLQDELATLEETTTGSIEARRNQLRLEREIAKINEDIADKRIQDIERQTGATEKEALRQLEIERDKYEAMGEAGALAQKKIEDAIRSTRDAQVRASNVQIAALTDVGFHAFDVARGMHRAFQGFFVNTLKGAVSFGQGLRNLFGGIVDAVLQEFARIAASQVFRVLFGAVGGQTATPGSLGAQVGQQSLQQSGGGGLLSSVVGGAGLVTTLSTGITEGASLAAGLTAQAFGAEAGALVGNIVLGGFAAPIIGAITNLIQGDISAAVGSAVAGTIGAVIGSYFGPVGGFIGGALGSFIGGFFETGGSQIFTSPSLVAVGEHGPERMTVEPLGAGMPRRGGDGGVQVNFNGLVVLDDLRADVAARQIADALARRQARVV